MKKLNKKGFTIVELVIVIAVIAILAGVLIPTFATVVDKANKSAAMQQAKNAYELYLANTAETGKVEENICIKSEYATGKYFYFHVKNGQFDSTAIAAQTNNTEHADTETGTSAFVKADIENGALKFASTTEGSTTSGSENP